MLKRTMTFAGVMVFASVAMAHEGRGPHGGRLADTPKHHLELLLNADIVEVYLSDKASQPIPAQGLSGVAIVVADGASTRIALTGDATKLSGKAAAKLQAGAKSVVQVKLADGQTIQASFE